ncbi:hypothetical protein RCL_jg29651.t1 [Rhizophagus clarus]|uniref:Uncharacterized protein n=1 Tax=Rhizophagus clarus TaxID=94130 RepID=A0A8H3L3I2_9GLOM|nr:hypothetical protein RCL_jg29651.t1 [Rhizophagus clarus]
MSELQGITLPISKKTPEFQDFMLPINRKYRNSKAISRKIPCKSHSFTLFPLSFLFLSPFFLSHGSPFLTTFLFSRLFVWKQISVTGLRTRIRRQSPFDA